MMELVLNYEVDIVCLQETWIRKCDGAIVEEIKSYGYDLIAERKARKCDVGAV